MKKVSLLLIITFFLFSCDTGNVFQDIGITKKPPLKFDTYNLYQINNNESEVNIFNLTNVVSSLSFNLNFTPIELNGTSFILKEQSQEELNAMSEMLSAPCYSENDLKVFLDKIIEDEQLKNSLENLQEILLSSKSSINSIISGLSNLKIDENQSTLSKDEIEKINSYIESSVNTLSSFFDSFYSSLSSFITTSKEGDFTNSDYLRLQLTLNVILSILDGSYSGLKIIQNKLGNTAEKPSFDLSTTEGVDDYISYLKENIESSGKDIILSFLTCLINPLSSYIQLSSHLSFDENLKLINVEDITSLLLGEKK